jgi:hypothetical protein
MHAYARFLLTKAQLDRAALSDLQIPSSVHGGGAPWRGQTSLRSSLCGFACVCAVPEPGLVPRAGQSTSPTCKIYFALKFATIFAGRSVGLPSASARACVHRARESCSQHGAPGWSAVGTYKHAQFSRKQTTRRYGNEEGELVRPRLFRSRARWTGFCLISRGGPDRAQITIGWK